MSGDRYYIQIHISGKVGQEKLSPKNYDIRDLKDLLENVNDLLSLSGKRSQDIVSFEMKDGSVNNRFYTAKQKVVEVGAVLALVAAGNTLEGLSPSTARALDGIQKTARATGYSFDFSTSEHTDYILKVKPETSFVQDDPVWADGEFYFYGQIIDAGGKKDPNIHLDVDRIGTLVISSEKDYLKNQNNNLLYHTVGVRVKGRQNMTTGEIDNKEMELIELIDYTPNYDENYLNGLIRKASSSWADTNADEYMKKIRGGGYEYA